MHRGDTILKEAIGPIGAVGNSNVMKLTVFKSSYGYINIVNSYGLMHAKQGYLWDDKFNAKILHANGGLHEKDCFASIALILANSPPGHAIPPHEWWRSAWWRHLV
jgi:hypothetical protein